MQAHRAGCQISDVFGLSFLLIFGCLEIVLAERPVLGLAGKPGAHILEVYI